MTTMFVLRGGGFSSLCRQRFLSVPSTAYRCQGRTPLLNVRGDGPSSTKIWARSFGGPNANFDLPEESPFSQTLRGCGQVIFMGQSVPGLFVLGGLAIGDPMLAAHSLGGAVWCTVLARGTGQKDADSTKQGLHAYNGVLVGAACSTFLGPTITDPTILAGSTIAGSTAAYGLTQILNVTYPFGPQWTYAFNAVTIGGLMAHKELFPPEVSAGDGGAADSALTDVLATTSPPFEFGFLEVFYPTFKGISQIFLVNSVLTGMVLCGAIFTVNPAAMAHACMGSIIGIVTTFSWDPTGPATTIQDGLVGFNPALTSLSVGALFRPSVGAFWLSVGGATATTLFAQIMGPFMMETCGTPAFTLPFCIVATATYGIGKAMKLEQ